jgi:hypothetical protein
VRQRRTTERRAGSVAANARGAISIFWEGCSAEKLSGFFIATDFAAADGFLFFLLIVCD